jgi:hypothetical protein
MNSRTASRSGAVSAKARLPTDTRVPIRMTSRRVCKVKQDCTGQDFRTSLPPNAHKNLRIAPTCNYGSSLAAGAVRGGID